MPWGTVARGYYPSPEKEGFMTDASSGGGYATPDVLVSTQWVADNLGHPAVRDVEANGDGLRDEQGYVRSAAERAWHTALQPKDRRDFVGPRECADLMERKGISNDTTVVLYGDKSNWWAAYALWFFK